MLIIQSPLSTGTSKVCLAFNASATVHLRMSPGKREEVTYGFRCDTNGSVGKCQEVVTPFLCLNKARTESLQEVLFVCFKISMKTAESSLLLHEI